MEKAKIAAAKKAVEYIQSGQIVGLGSGSTARHFVEALIDKVEQGLKIRAVSSSRETAALAHHGHIPLLDLNSVPYVDVTVDGADEIDHHRRLIKGGGGAHVREKILAAASKRFIIIVDSSKLVEELGRALLPIEVLPFGAAATRRHIEQLGLKGAFRANPDESYFVTENGNFLFDAKLSSANQPFEPLHQILCQLPGVVDTGFFFNYATDILVGYEDGSVKTL